MTQHRLLLLNFGHRLTTNHKNAAPSVVCIRYQNCTIYRDNASHHWQWHQCESNCQEPRCQLQTNRSQSQHTNSEPMVYNHNPTFRSVSIIGSRLELDFNKLPRKFISIVSRFSTSNYIQAPYLRLRPPSATFNRAHLHRPRGKRSRSKTSRRCLLTLASSYRIYRLFKPTRIAIANPLELHTWSPTIQPLVTGTDLTADQ
jgi:hypothetical protein